MALTQAIQNDLRDLIRMSRRIHFVLVAVLGAPAFVLIAFLLFPLLETRGLGYPLFHLACAVSIALAGAGIVAWTAEKRYRDGFPAWICLLFLAVACGGSLVLRIVGDFYWAFDRGYFLE